MNFWSWITGATRATTGPNVHPRDPVLADIWGRGATTASGARVTADSAMKLGPVWACVHVLSETVAMLPLILYKRLDNDGKERARKHPLFSLFAKPNRFQNGFEWREMLTAHLALRGNAFCEITGTGGRGIAELVPLHPDRVKVDQLDDGSLVYTHYPKTGVSRLLLSSEVFHIRTLSVDGVRGLSPISHYREAIGAGMAAEEYASRFWSNDATPPGVLKMSGVFDSDENRAKFRERWQESQTAANRHKIAVLEEGMEYEALGITARDAQFIESRKFSVTDIARLFRVPPHMIGDLERATFSNIKDQQLGFSIYTMLPWFERWTSAIDTQLLSVQDREQFFSEFLIDALLKGDTKTRFEAYQLAIMNGWLNRNEVRIIENRNPEPGLDDFVVPTNMTTVGEPAKDGAAGSTGRRDRHRRLLDDDGGAGGSTGRRDRDRRLERLFGLISDQNLNSEGDNDS